jgi:hypothetical protein
MKGQIRKRIWVYSDLEVLNPVKQSAPRVRVKVYLLFAGVEDLQVRMPFWRWRLNKDRTHERANP